LRDEQSRSHISIAATLDMSLEEQTLHLASLGMLLRFNLVERELQGATGSQPSLQQGELEGRRSGGGHGGGPWDSRIGSGPGSRGRNAIGGNGVAILVIDIFLRY
jgi:hypothetical protein